MKPNMAAIEEYRKKVLVQFSAANLRAGYLSLSSWW
jgi:hypothetical protein